MVVTSPPYWGLRKYAGAQDVEWGGDAGCEHEWGEVQPPPRIGKTPQGARRRRSALAVVAGLHATRGRFCQKCGAWRGAYGNEPTPELYVDHTVEVLRAVHRILRKDGVVFWNVGDSYYSNASNHQEGVGQKRYGESGAGRHNKARPHPVLKQKDLCLIPHRIAIAAQEDGWYVRSDIIWSKPNPMPESVSDRPTVAHEHILLLSKSERYFWNAKAVASPVGPWVEKDSRYGPGAAGRDRSREPWATKSHENPHRGFKETNYTEANCRNVWTIGFEPYTGEHYAAFPSELPRRCILAGSRPGDLVLDPFCGTGTTCRVADDLDRAWLGFDISAKYEICQEERFGPIALALSKERLAGKT